ncbi:MAG: hypothetical protein Q9169_000735 [Polycauliona sp. 2 TL-2023]
MAEPSSTSVAISAAFPAPPPFYQAFTTSNLGHLSSLQEAHPSFTLLDLPPELRNLLPPPLPLPGQEYRIFGETHATPAPAPTEAPPKDTPNPHRLINTTRQLLLAFLSLTNSLAMDPDKWAPKWDDMKALLSEAHGIVNEYRPHQARETLIQMMEEQVERSKAETQGCKEVCERVRKVVGDVESREALTVPNMELQGEHRPSNKCWETTSGLDATEKHVWHIIEEEIGAFE